MVSEMAYCLDSPVMGQWEKGASVLLVFSPYKTRCLGILFRTVISIEGEGVGSEDQRTRQGIGHHYHHTVQGEQLGSWGGREGGREGGRGRERERER